VSSRHDGDSLGGQRAPAAKIGKQALLEIDIPGADSLRLEHLVADYNGTLARAGVLLPGVAEALGSLAQKLDLHVVTADTFGQVRQALGTARCASLGNGRNDRLMLAAAELGIAVTQGEGAAVESLLAARVAAPDIGVALGLLLHPGRLAATLRL
jgi:soluble P-type ATPase